MARVALLLSICSLAGCAMSMRVTGTTTHIPSISPGTDVTITMGGGKRIDEHHAILGLANFGYAELPGQEGSALYDVFGVDLVGLRGQFGYRVGLRAGARIGLSSAEEVMAITEQGGETPDGHGVLGVRMAVLPWSYGLRRGAMQVGLEVGVDAALGQDGGGPRMTPLFTVGLVFEVNVLDAFGPR